MNAYFYVERNTLAPLKIRAKQKPSIKRMPLSGTWVVREWSNGWHIPCFPEIIWETIRDKLIYMGKIKD